MDMHALFDPQEIPLEKLLPDSGFCGIFHTIGVVGDSLASGTFQTQDAEGNNQFAQMYDYSWCSIMAHATGSAVRNFARGGMSAKEFMESYAEENGCWEQARSCQAFIIALGVNDVRERLCPIGSLDDLKEDYRDNADTFAGHYDAIIHRLHEIQPNAKIFVMTMHQRTDPTDRALFERHAEIVRGIAKRHENCYVMDFMKYAPVTDEAYREKFYLNGHLNPCGYVFSAKLIMSYMDYIIRHNIQDFTYVSFIGKEGLLEKDPPPMEEA